MSTPMPNLQLARVHGGAMAASRALTVGSLRGVTAMLSPGIHGFLGSPVDGTAALVQLCAGRARPKYGQLTVAGREPATDPGIRARIGALLPQPALPPCASVEALGAILTAAAACDLRQGLGLLGLEDWGSRRLSSLADAELRALDLAVALSSVKPLVLALYEPFSGVALADFGRLRQRLLELAREGCCVLIAASAPADLEGLVEQVYLLDQGRLIGDRALASWPAEPAEGLVLWVESSEAVRGLVAALSASEAILGVAWQMPQNGEPAQIEIQAAQLEAAALAVAQIAVASGVQVVALQRRPPALEPLRERLRMQVAEATSRPWRAPLIDGAGST